MDATARTCQHSPAGMTENPTAPKRAAAARKPTKELLYRIATGVSTNTRKPLRIVTSPREGLAGPDAGACSLVEYRKDGMLSRHPVTAIRDA